MISFSDLFIIIPCTPSTPPNPTNKVCAPDVCRLITSMFRKLWPFAVILSWHFCTFCQYHHTNNFWECIDCIMPLCLFIHPLWEELIGFNLIYMYVYVCFPFIHVQRYSVNWPYIQSSREQHNTQCAPWVLL